MSINAVQHQIVVFLTGLPSKGYPTPIAAQVALPTGTNAKMARPEVYVWGGAATESRIAIPRGQGWKQDLITVSVWLFGVEQANDPDRAWKFPVLIQTVRKALAGASPMPIQITDPQTGEVSTMLDLGEEMSWEYDIDRALADQRLVRNICRLDVSLREEFNA